MTIGPPLSSLDRAELAFSPSGVMHLVLPQVGVFNDRFVPFDHYAKPPGEPWRSNPVPAWHSRYQGNGAPIYALEITTDTGDTHTFSPLEAGLLHRVAWADGEATEGVAFPEWRLVSFVAQLASGGQLTALLAWDGEGAVGDYRGGGLGAGRWDGTRWSWLMVEEDTFPRPTSGPPVMRATDAGLQALYRRPALRALEGGLRLLTLRPDGTSLEAVIGGTQTLPGEHLLGKDGAVYRRPRVDTFGGTGHLVVESWQHGEGWSEDRVALFGPLDTPPALAVGPAGDLYVLASGLYKEVGRRVYRKPGPESPWVVDAPGWMATGVQEASATVGTDGRIHYLARYGYDVKYGVLPDEGLVEYEVWRQRPGMEWERLGATRQQHWEDPGLPVGGTANYAVYPLTPDGRGAPSLATGAAGADDTLGPSGEGAKIGLGPDGRLVAVWQDPNTRRLAGSAKGPGQEWSSLETVAGPKRWPVAVLATSPLRLLAMDLLAGHLVEVSPATGEAIPVSAGPALFPGGRAARSTNGWVAAYADEGDGRLLVAFGTEDGWAEVETGISASSALPGLAVDSSGQPHLLYAPAEGGGVRHAWRDPSGTWQREVVEEGPGLAYEASAVFGPDGRLHTVYNDSHNLDLRYAVSGVDGGWQAAPLTTTPYGAVDIGLTATADGTIHLVFHDVVARDLVHGRLPIGAGWSVKPVVSIGDVGRYASAAAGLDGRLHIIYLDRANEEVRHLWLAAE